jgi:aryl-alcohol dehydrogenase-like predicted oxidoreductase
MSQLLAARSGKFLIGGELPVHRLGFGAMRITGSGVWGAPANPAEARRVLERLPGLGINFIDTADSYGPGISENLIRDVLYPYKGLVIATKGGLVRPGPRQWIPRGDPAYLRQCVEGSLKRLGVSCIDLWQLHRIDASVPRDEQFAVIKAMQDEGLIRHVGLSQVSVEDIMAASKVLKIATVQNLYNLGNRGSDDVLAYCETHNIGFIPWYPLADGTLSRAGSITSSLAAKYRATPGQIALAWLIKRSPVMLPIPGTSQVSHLEENAAAAALQIEQDDLELLTAQAGRR